MDRDYECWDILDHTLEYFDDTHTYLVDGIEVPSITQILKVKFGNKYDGISRDVLNHASIKGSNLHKAIEVYEKTGEELSLKTYDKYGIEDSDSRYELRNYRFLKKHYKFEVLDNEVPIILFKNDKPIAAGRLDLVLNLDGDIGGGDIKRTSTLDKEYLAYQLNLYRIGYRQCYGVEWKFLKGLHLREDVRKFINIPVNEDMAWSLIELYEKEQYKKEEE